MTESKIGEANFLKAEFTEWGGEFLNRLQALLACAMNEDQSSRELRADERRLVQWMLEHGEPEAREFLPQLAVARVTPWRCKCGCPSFNFLIAGYPPAPNGVHPIAHFVFGADEEFAGIFVFESGGILSGVEVYSVADDAPSTLPTPEMLRPFSNGIVNG